MIRKAAIVGGLAGALVVGAVVPSLAQYVIVSPGGPYVQSGPYGGYAGGYAYAPGGYILAPRYRYWNDPAGYDTGGMPLFLWRARMAAGSAQRRALQPVHSRHALAESLLIARAYPTARASRSSAPCRMNSAAC